LEGQKNRKNFAVALEWRRHMHSPGESTAADRACFQAFPTCRRTENFSGSNTLHPKVTPTVRQGGWYSQRHRGYVENSSPYRSGRRIQPSQSLRCGQREKVLRLPRGYVSPRTVLP